MIEDSAAYFGNHQETETRKRGLALCTLVRGFRDAVNWKEAVNHQLTSLEAREFAIIDRERKQAEAERSLVERAAISANDNLCRVIAEKLADPTAHLVTIEDWLAFAVRQTLERVGGNRASAAKLLGIGRQTLYNYERLAKSPGSTSKQIGESPARLENSQTDCA
jgi:DNA-binding NtrC family response regulator